MGESERTVFQRSVLKELENSFCVSIFLERRRNIFWGDPENLVFFLGFSFSILFVWLVHNDYPVRTIL